MAKVLVTESYLENIGDAIRSKLGGSDTYTPAEMAGAISQIHGDPVLEALSVTENGTYTPSSGKDGFSQAVVNVPNSYAAGDEGKVVSNGALVAQTSDTVTENGTYDTTLNNSIVVNVANSYTQSDEGKVVDNGALVAQTSQNITENGTYDTTLKNEIVVNVSGGGGGQQVNPFNSSTVTLYHSTNVTVTDSSVDSAGTMEMECSVTANNSYEGFNIELDNLVANTAYELDFDFQFINAGFYNAYGRGYKVTSTAETNYSSYTNWDRNLDANNNVQSKKAAFIATGTKMYLSFNISDLQNGSPSFEITNFKLKTYGGGGGTTVLEGTDVPSDSLGNDGDIYLQYDETGYIKSTGTQRIQLDYVYQLNSKLVFRGKLYRNSKSYPMLFGCQSGAARWVWCYFHASYGSMYVMGQNTEYRAGTSTGIYDTDEVVEVTATNGHIEAKDIYGDTIYSADVTAGTTAGSSSSPLMLFQRPDLPSSCEGTVTLYDLKIYEGDTLVRHYVPSKENNKYCLYEEFTETYFHSTKGDLLGAEAGTIMASHLKVGGHWQNLIGSNIDDVSI